MITTNKAEKRIAVALILAGMSIIASYYLMGCAPPVYVPYIQIPGPAGSPGPQGLPGLSAVFTNFEAPQGSCGLNPDGSYVQGTVFVVAQDVNQTGVWAQNDTDQVSTLVCNGVNGQQGQQGAAGQNSTPVTVVQFCPNVTSYPGTFSEVGFCISNNLWAVYSQNDGFLTEVVPGEYSSDGINSSCDFSVGPNCTVTDN